MSLRHVLLVGTLISAGCATSPAARPGPTDAALHRLMECPDEGPCPDLASAKPPLFNQANPPIQLTRRMLDRHAHQAVGMSLACEIDVDGQAKRCAVRQALPDPEDAEMNASALATVSTWRYSPASLDGKPVLVKLVIPVRFIVP